MNNWKDIKKIYEPIDNKSVQIDFIDTMTAEFPLFEAYYDPSVEIHGKEGTVYGGQMAENSPARWSDELMFNRWPKSKDLETKIPLIIYGLFGDRSSYDLAKMAFEAPELLKKHLDSKVNNVYTQWKRTVVEVILYGLCDKTAYSESAKIELPSNYFNNDNDTLKRKQEKALKLVADIEKRCYELSNYSKDFNKAGEEAVVANLQELIMVIEPEIDTFLNVYGLSQSFNAGYLKLTNKVGKVIVAKLPKIKVGDKKPVVFWDEDENTHKLTPTTYKEGDGQIGNWGILIHDRRFYRMNDALNVPKDEGVFIETAFYKTQLKNLIGKWYGAVQGTVPFVNSCYWTLDGTAEVNKGKGKKEGNSESEG
jgi:hypothetical protein